MRIALKSAVALGVALAAAPAFPAERCRVTDPTGTPLNVRSECEHHWHDPKVRQRPGSLPAFALFEPLAGDRHALGRLCPTISRKAEGREAEQHHGPCGGLRNPLLR